MRGTTIKSVRLIRVIDGDTISVDLNGNQESLRLACLDTEESYHGGSKPVTECGKLATRWAKDYFGTDQKGIPVDKVEVDLEFDTRDPIPVCLKKHRGNYSRLICYVYSGNENYNLRVVREGLSPYFLKYGRSRLYHAEFLAAESAAQEKEAVIWNPERTKNGKSRNYSELIPWWNMRDSIIQDYRKHGIHAGVKSVRLDYDEIVEAAKFGSDMTVFCDLQNPGSRRLSGGAVVFAGSFQHRFNLWIPERESEKAQAILTLLGIRYSDRGRNYVYVSGKASLHPESIEKGNPQIVLKDIQQLSDLPPGL